MPETAKLAEPAQSTELDALIGELEERVTESELPSADAETIPSVVTCPETVSVC